MIKKLLTAIRLAVRLVVSVPMWVRNFAMKAVLAFTGLVMVAAVYKYRNTDYAQLPAWVKPWANPEDWQGGVLNYAGSVPRWYHKKWPDKSEFYKFYRYHAIRNPGDGLRGYRWSQLHIEPSKAGYWTPKYMRSYEARHADEGDKVLGYIAWQGWYCGMKWLFLGKKKYVEFKWGFRIEPRDVEEGLPDTSVRKKIGASMATKLVVREIP